MRSSLSQSYAASSGYAEKTKELRQRIIFTILALVVYRFGTYIPLPGINPIVLKQISSQNQGGILGMLNMFSGGALGRMTIFALNVMPYITASIIMQLMTTTSKNLEELKKSGATGRRKINQYTKYLTVILALVQGFGISVGLENMSSSAGSAVLYSGMFFRITTVITLTGSTIFLIWLGDQITDRGLGNGVSLIIFAGIVAELPGAFISTFELGRTGALSTVLILSVILLVIGLIATIIFMERSMRKLIIQYPQRKAGQYASESSHLPLKLNTAGVIPPIFASSILLFPMTILSFGEVGQGSEIIAFISRNLAHGKPLFMLLYASLIIFFGFFYTAVVFNTKETADYLKKFGGYIPGIRPGDATAKYLDNVLTRLTLIGTGYLALICIIPEFIIAKYSLPFYLGGTSLLIVVNVAIDTLSQAQTHLISNRYDSIRKKSKIKSR
jgi:preprotein translocase subunit SecY